MIFKTFDSDIDKISAKWGIFGKSFNDIGNAIIGRISDINKGFQATDDLVGSIKNSDSIWKRLYPSKETIQSQLIDVDSVIPKIDSDNFDFDNWINRLNEVDKKVKSNKVSWQDFSNSLDDNQKWIAKWGEETQGTIRTQEGLIKANQAARDAAIAHNAALKQQTLSAKAGQVALKGLAIAGNIAVSFGISLAIEGLIKLSESLSNTLDKQKEKLEETKNSISSYESEIDELQSKISENQKKIDEINANPLDIVDKNTLSTLKDENAELTQQLETIKAIKSDAKELAEVQTIQILENTSTITGLMQLINSLKEGKIFEEGFFDGLHNLNTGGLGFMHGFEDLKKGNYVKAVLKGVEGVVAPVGFIDALVAKKENELSPTEETEEQIKKVSELRTELQNLEKQRGSMDEEKYKKKHAELTEEFTNEQTALISKIKSLQTY